MTLFPTQSYFAYKAPEPDWTPLEHVVVGGLRVATAGRQELTNAMVRDCRVARPGQRARLIFDSNAHAISLLKTDPVYRNAIRKADVVHADGGFVVSVSRYVAGNAVSERSATTDMIYDFAAAATENNLSFYLLGGTEEVNRECVRLLREWFPSLSIVGQRNGYFTQDEEEAVLEDIRKTNPDILWVGLGKPLEQLFCIRHSDRLTTRWAVTCGGCFNYVTGAYKRAPKWMQSANLEWLFRACTEWRLLRRYIETSPRAIFRSLVSRDKAIYPSARETGDPD